ncbi:MAG: Vps62-related protein [Terracidiphilus sp.]|nr:Vps62-related protein [Terracidiphilus sp.]
MGKTFRILTRAAAAAGCLMAAFAGHAQAVSLAVIQEYAPSIYLNAYEKNMPSSVDNFFAQSKLMSSGGIVLASPATYTALAANTSASNYLTPTNGVFPTASNDFQSGDPIVSIGSNTGESNSPVYVKTIDNGTYIDLKYYMFYTWNGFQGFQAGILVGLQTEPYYFDWSQFALHYGDWEHVTVRISEDTTKLIGVFYSQHGDAQFVTNPALDGTHPIVYSAWDSHANYPTSGNNINTVILNSPGVIPVSWLKVSDITTNGGGTTFAPYSNPSPFYSNGVQWKPWQNTSQLVLLDNNSSAAQWLSFLGPWGPTYTNAIEDPPSALPSGSPTELYALAVAGNLTGLLSSKYTQSGGPYGPQAQGWNVSNEGIAGIYKITSVQSGLALDGGANTSGTLVQMWTSNGTVDQQWLLKPSGSGTSITSVQSGLALDGGTNSSGTHPQMWTSNGTADQQWTFQTSGSGQRITSVQSALVLDGGTNTQGTNPQMYSNNGTADQQWVLTLLP